MNQNVHIQMPKVKVLPGSGSMLYYHDVTSKKELSSLIASMLQTVSINPSLFEAKSAIFKVGDMLYRIVFNAFFAYPQFFTFFTLYKVNEELTDLQLTDWNKGFDRKKKTEDGFKEYSFKDIWVQVEEGPPYGFNPPKEDEEYIPRHPGPHECYIWLNITSPAFVALFTSLDKSNA